VALKQDYTGRHPVDPKLVLIDDILYKMIFIDFNEERFVYSQTLSKLINILYILHNLFNRTTFLLKKRSTDVYIVVFNITLQ